MPISIEVLQALGKRAQANSRNPLKPAVQVHPDHLKELVLGYTEYYHTSTSATVAHNVVSNNEPIDETSPRHHQKLKEVGLPDFSAVDNAMRDNKQLVAALAGALINSHWYLQDPDGKMLKSPEDVLNFLQDMTREHFMWNDLNPQMRSYMNIIYQAYRHTRNRQIAIVRQMRKEGKPIDEICDALRQYLRTDDDAEF